MMSVQLPRRARLPRGCRLRMGGRGVAMSYAPALRLSASGPRHAGGSARRLPALPFGTYVVPAVFLGLALYLVFR